MDLPYLTASLQNLRDKWPEDWPGLDLVVRNALSQLGHDQRARLTARNKALHDCIFSVIQAIEKDGIKRAGRQEEPAYHNRLHFSDAVVSLCVLLSNERVIAGRPRSAALSHAEWLCMLTMVSHDFMHNGRVNAFRSEIEAMTVQALLPHMSEHGVHADDQALVSDLILKTDPVFVAQSHQNIQGLRFDVADPRCMLVLIQECDILASALPATGGSLTQKLSLEWSKVAPERSQALLPPKGRLMFLKHAARFSSPSSRLLGVQTAIDQQIQALQQSC
jgi:hypothetical protein